MKQLKLILVVGARPNFIKASPIIREFRKCKNIKFDVVHTGQHYSSNMSDNFLVDLNIPIPYINLGIGSGTHAEHIARTIVPFERLCKNYKPDGVIVLGDVNSTLACSLAVAKLPCKLIHVEAGLRCHDKTMPEEINRTVVDRLSDVLFTPNLDAITNLTREGITDNVFGVGNVVVDNLFYYKDEIFGIDNEYGVKKPYVVVTLHRPSNVDNEERLRELFDFVNSLTLMNVDVIFPMHPRVRKRAWEFHAIRLLREVTIVKPMGYFEFLSLVKDSMFVVTDSGGLQVETSVLNVPCFTIRDNTEWTCTTELGTNIVTGTHVADICKHVLYDKRKERKQNVSWWDGYASNRITNILKEVL